MRRRLGNLNSIRVFEAAARLGSFKAAAVELHITPTAVSHQIRNLEAQLGVSLFERRTRAVRLTDAGSRLADAARLSLQTLADAIEEISGQPKTLTVNTTSAFAALWLVPRLQSFYDRYPDLRVVVQTDEQPVDLKRDRHVDIAIRYGREPIGEEAELLLCENFGLYGTADTIARLEAGRSVTLFETQWKSAELPPVTAGQWLGRFAPRRKRAVPYSYDQELHVIQAALAGQGMAFVSNLLVASAVQWGWLQSHRPECRLPGFGYYLLSARGRLEKVEQFRSWLLGELPASPAPAIGGESG
jgi:DNA-binding transcriptional LysR family regulator